MDRLPAEEGAGSRREEVHAQTAAFRAHKHKHVHNPCGCQTLVNRHAPANSATAISLSSSGSAA
eukprot:8834714-Alexandrium_andersonii.AAC.1